MPRIKRITALFLVDPESARAVVLEKVREHRGNLSAVARDFGIHYVTLRRRVRRDAVLRDAIRQIRRSFEDADHSSA